MEPEGPDTLAAGLSDVSSGTSNPHWDEYIAQDYFAEKHCP
jgi:hypothetical protein